MFDRFSASARHWGNRLGVDTDDLLQDTAVEFYATLARQRGADDPQPGLNGRVVNTADRPRQSTMVNPGGWIHRIAYNIAARRVAGTNSSADLAALREYRNRLQQTENRMRACAFRGGGGPAGRRDPDVQAAAPAPDPWVSTAGRGPCPPRHSGRTGTSPSNRTRWAAASSRPTPPVPRPRSGWHRNGNRGRSAAQRPGVGRGGRRDRRAGRGSRRHRPGDSSRDAARLVDDAGGAVAVSRRWAHDPADPAVAALFTPFGRLDTDEQRAVIRTIHRSGGYGDQVWAAALRSATYRPQRSAG